MTNHPNATDYRNRSERAEQEATEAWACADRMAEALEAFLKGADNGIISVKVDKDARNAN